MKILLVVPTHNYNTKYPSFLSVSDFPTGLAYIAASLKEAGHEVHGLNLNNDIGYKTAYDMIVTRIDKAIREVKPELIGLSGLCTDYHFLRDAIEIIRAVDRSIPIVLGGGIVNNDAKFIFNLLKPDYAIVGEGEETIVNLISVLENTDKPPMPQNIWYKVNGETTCAGVDHTYRPLDQRALPDYDVFGINEMLDDYSMSTRLLYRYSRPDPRPFIIVTARSCPFKCSFCVHDHGPKYRARSIENIINEIKVTYDKYHFNILLVLDELFAVNKKRMTEFCETLLKAKEEYKWDFDWTFQTHANAQLDKESLELAKQSGCFFFSYGLESASPTVLESMNKKMKISQIEEAIKLARETKVGFGGNLIFGDPAETEETIAESLSFWMKYGGSEFIFLSNVTPYPGSRIFDDCVKRGLIKDKAQFYETIDKNYINMTTIPNADLGYRMQAFNFLERSWLFPKTTKATCKEVPADNPILRYFKSKMYEVKAKCPHCGEEVTYRDMFTIGKQDTFLGTGCTKCNRRIRIDIKGGRMISAEIKAQAEALGFAKSGDIGGQPKQTYWTPDGRQIRAMPDMHEYAKKDKDGRIIEAGLRDANLDNGWLTSKPQILQLYCDGCDKWHKTPQEVKECRTRKLAVARKYQHLAKKELKQTEDDGRIDRLENAVSELTVMMKKLLEKS